MPGLINCRSHLLGQSLPRADPLGGAAHPRTWTESPTLFGTDPKQVPVASPIRPPVGARKSRTRLTRTRTFLCNTQYPCWNPCVLYACLSTSRQSPRCVCVWCGFGSSSRQRSDQRELRDLPSRRDVRGERSRSPSARVSAFVVLVQDIVDLRGRAREGPHRH